MFVCCSWELTDLYVPAFVVTLMFVGTGGSVSIAAIGVSECDRNVLSCLDDSGGGSMMFPFSSQLSGSK